MYVQPTAPRAIGGVIDDAIKLYRASFRSCWPLGLIGSVILAAMSMSLLITAPTLAGVRNPAQLWQLFRQPALWGWLPILVIGTLVSFAAVIACQNALAAGTGPINVGHALGAAFARLHWLLLSILVWLMIGLSGAGVAMVPAGVGARVFAVLAWLILVVYLWGRLQLWMVALFAEDAGTFRAMGVSWDLIRGHWWRSVTILTLGVIIVLVISVVFGAVGGLILVAFRPDPMSALLGNQVISAIERVFVTPMIPAVTVAMYYDFKLRREGGDLAARASSLQTA